MSSSTTFGTVKSAALETFTEAKIFGPVSYALMGLCHICTHDFPLHSFNVLLSNAFFCSIALLCLTHLALKLLDVEAYKYHTLTLTPATLPITFVVHTFFWTFVHECGHFLALSLWYKSPQPTITIFSPGNKAAGITRAFQQQAPRTFSWLGKMVSPKLFITENILCAGICMEIFVFTLFLYYLYCQVSCYVKEKDDTNQSRRPLSPTYMTILIHATWLSAKSIIAQIFFGHDMFILQTRIGGSMGYYVFLCTSNVFTLWLVGYVCWQKAIQPALAFFTTTLSSYLKENPSVRLEQALV